MPFVKAEPWEAGGAGTADQARQESFKGFPPKELYEKLVSGANNNSERKTCCIAMTSQ